jgi:hypothetical protein
MTTPRLGAPELATSQTNKEETVNEQIRYLESAAGHFIFKDRDLSTPPVSPADGDCYLVKATGTGTWAGQDGKVAYFLNTAWVFITPREGFTAWVNDEDVFIGYDGAAWNVIASPSGVYVPLSYLDTDGTLAANSDTKLASQKATKTYVDGKVAGLSWKQAVRAATTSNHTLATAYANGQVIDGVTLATGDRVLIKNQTTASENGIYVVPASGAPTRATDADSGAELVNATVYVSEGTTNADTQWTCTNNATITVGTTALTFAQLATGGGGLLAANNLSDVADPAAAGANLRPVESLIVACSDEATALTTGTSKITFRMPYAFTVTAVRASLTTAQTSGSIFTVDINEGGTSIISTKLTIDNTEKTSTTAATAAVISDSSLADDAEMTVDIDQVGDGTAKGLKVYLIGHRT